jgi:hypothetical protein
LAATGPPENHSSYDDDENDDAGNDLVCRDSGRDQIHQFLPPPSVRCLNENPLASARFDSKTPAMTTAMQRRVFPSQQVIPAWEYCATPWQS